MFKNEISSSPLMNDTANAVLGRISGDRFLGDCSFVSTMRALLHPRVPKDESVTLKISRSDFSVEDVKNRSKKDLARKIYEKNNSIGRSGSFVLHYFNNVSPEANAKNMEIAVSEFEECNPGYGRLVKVTEFYRKAFPVACFINPDIKSVVLFVEQMDYRRFHYVQVGLIAAIPWYIDPKKGLAPLEMQLVESLTKNDPDIYRDCIQRVYDSFDFRSEIIKQKLDGFEMRYIKDAIVNSENIYTNVIHEINEANRRIGELLRRKADLMMQIAGMRLKVEEGNGESEIMEYFLANKSLSLIDTNDNQVTFTVKSCLEYYDPEMAERAVGNKNSLLYRDASSVGTKDELKKLYTAIFIDNILKINVCAAFRLSINGGVSPIGGHSFGDEYRGYMPHPHIDRYTCMGDYVRIINELMQNNDYIMAIEQCVASCRSLNFGDSTVLNHFVSVLMGSSQNARCIVLPDGSIVDAKNAIKWLNAQEGGSK